MTLTENDIIALTNKQKRQAVLDLWQEWPVWASDPEIGLTVHKLDLPDGSAFTASVYEGDRFKRCGCYIMEPRPQYHLIGFCGKLASGTQGESVFLDVLMEMRKRLMEGKK